MGFDTLENLKDPKKYQEAVKSELGKIAAKPVKFQYFEDFTFKDNKKGKVLLVGDTAIKLTALLTKSGAKFKAAGLCVLNSKTKKVDFAKAQGAVDLSSLKAALNGTGKDSLVNVVNALAKPGDKEGDNGKPAAGPEKAKADGRLVGVTKFFDAVKSKFTDDERKQVREKIANCQEQIEKGKFPDAMKDCDTIVKDIKAIMALNAGPSPQKVKADNRLAAVTKFFDSMKSKLTDDERKQLRNQIATVQEHIAKLKFGEAHKECDAIEKNAKAFLASNAGPPPEKAKAEARLAAVTKVFDAGKSKLTDDERKQLRGQIADVQDKIAGSKFAEALKDCDAIEKDVKAFLALDSGPPPEQAKAEARLAAVTKYFDANKSKLTDDERKEVRGQIADVQDKIADKKFADAIKECEKIEKDVKSFLALNSGPSPEQVKAENRLAEATKFFDANKSKLTDDERKEVRGQIADVQDKIADKKFADALKGCDKVEKAVKAFLALN